MTDHPLLSKGYFHAADEKAKSEPAATPKAQPAAPKAQAHAPAKSTAKK